MTRFISLIKLLILIAILAGTLQLAAASNQPDANYQLGAGDKLSITVFNQDDLSGEYTVNGSGRFSMPFIDRVQAAGLTIPELIDVIINKLKPDYLLNPRVSIEVLNFRPYYIIGEISSSGSYPFVEGITYLNAVAIAGGFTYRARQKYVMVKRKDNPDNKELKLKLDEFVLPGDIIRVTERLF